MLLLSLIGFAFLIAIIKYKNIKNIENKSIKFYWLILVGFIIQIAIFNGKFAQSKLNYLTPIFYSISLLVLLIFLLANFKEYQGIKVTTFGFILNVIAILANGGYMPQSIKQLSISGQTEKVKLLTKYGHFYNATIMNSKTKLNLLGDRILLSIFGKFKTVYSIGDIIIMIGIAIFVFELFAPNKNAGEKALLHENNKTITKPN